jgi:hypothetical protein
VKVPQSSFAPGTSCTSRWIFLAFSCFWISLYNCVNTSSIYYTIFNLICELHIDRT